MDALKTNLKLNDLKTVISFYGYDLDNAAAYSPSMGSSKQAKKLTRGCMSVSEDAKLPLLALSTKGHVITARQEVNKGLFAEATTFHLPTKDTMRTVLDNAYELSLGRASLDDMCVYSGSAAAGLIGGALAGAVIGMAGMLFFGGHDFVPYIAGLGAFPGAFAGNHFGKSFEKGQLRGNYSRLSALEGMASTGLKIHYGKDAMNNLALDYARLK